MGTAETSEKAYAARPHSVRKRVLDYLRAHGGQTNESLSLRLGVLIQTVTGAVNDLTRRHWIKDSGKRRKTSTGREAIVWEAWD